MRPTGSFTQRDPIGLAGGLNEYTFASADPINNADPSGLLVCFGAEGREQLVRAAEQATGSSISVDGSGCIASITANDTSAGATFLRNRLEALQNDAAVYQVKLGRRSDYDPASRTAGVDRTGVFLYSTRNSAGECTATSVDWGFGGAIAHELLGHAWAKRFDPIREATAGQEGREQIAMNAENVYFKRLGRPTRCSY